MSAVKKVLIVGGGFSGMAAAIQLRRIGVDVDLVEIDPGWRSYGAGISIGGSALRAFKTLGILEQFLLQGYGSDGVDLFAPTGHLIAQLPTPRLAGPEVPGGAGIMRPVLAKILADATNRAGAYVLLGETVKFLVQGESWVDATFSAGNTVRYDLVIGADGLYSTTREMIFPDAPRPRYSGQGVWRAVVPRPANIVRAAMWIGPKVKTGVNPVSKAEMYVFVTEDRAVNERIDPQRWPTMLADLLAPFPDPVMQAVRGQLGPDAQVVYRPLEGLLLRGPWHQGRVQLIGDAVHATTPHLAAGAGIGIEDAIVLAEELAAAKDVSEALTRFRARRWERCRMVVENSARLGEIEQTGGDKEEHGQIMRESLMALAQPI
jgi:2-polyprenyl-6-methoxyphenol hydroxylase-like FAD-dependent oxidoreductase